MLFFTGISRYAEKIAKTYVNDISKKEMQITKMSAMVDEGLIILNDGDLDDFGILLNEAWKKKKELSDEVTTSRIDEIYDKAMNAGATGGKISGAGGGGFMFFYVPEEKQDDLVKGLSDLTHVPFKFEESGSTVIFDEKKNDE